MSRNCIGLSWHRCFSCCLLVILSSVASSGEEHYVQARKPSLRAKHAALESTNSPISTRIIGGEKAMDSMPWAVLFNLSGGNKITCSGSVIAPRWIVTAAHCVLNKKMDGYVTRLGTEIKYGCSDMNSDSCKVAHAVSVTAHPCYTPSSDQDHDDVALIELDRDLGITPVIVDGWDWGVVNMSTGDDVALAGFGTVSNSIIAASPHLMRVTVPLATEADCVAANPWRHRMGYIDFANMWCTGGEEGRDSCYGDSGGPAVFRHSGVDFLVGILSIGSEKPAGSACGMAGRYGVYTKLRHYSAWLRAVVFREAQAAVEGCPAVAVWNATEATSVEGALPESVEVEERSSGGSGAVWSAVMVAGLSAAALALSAVRPAP